MKKLECFRSADAVRIHFNGKLGKAVISGLLVSSMLAVGCSKEKSKATSENQNSGSQMALSQPVAPNPVTATPAPAPKKVVKKRPSTVRFADQNYGLSFRYPRKYSVKGADETDSTAMNFVQIGGLTDVAVELPKDSYPETDFAAASFRVNVNKNVSEAECGQFAFPLSLNPDKDPVQVNQVAIGGLDMQEVEDISGDDTKQEDTKYYHLFQNGACYEFALGLSTASDGGEDGVNQVDRGRVFQKLETILATVKIKPEATPQVASGEVPAPTSQDGMPK